MSITTKLAYSQLKNNRSRTGWALAAVALSTALTTAVCSFVASGNALLVALLGADYGDYGGTYRSLLLLPAALFGALILAMSYIVISNVFRVSAGERAAQFGILKCVGATPRQIAQTVMAEGLLLCAGGVPAGILLGLALAWAGVGVANRLLAGLNALAELMVHSFYLEVHFVFSLPAILFSALISTAAVLLSALAPARRAARACAADSVRGAGEVRLPTSPRALRTGKLVQRLFGIEGVLAAKNLKRSRRSFRATVLSLSVGVVLFVALGGLGSQAAALTAYARPHITQTVIAEYFSNREETTDPATGREASTYLAPIDSAVGDALTDELAAFDGDLPGGVYGLGVDLMTYHTTLPAALLTPAFAAHLDEERGEAEKITGQYELTVELITLDAAHYAQLCAAAGVPTGSTLLLNHYRYNANGTEVTLTPYTTALTAALQTASDTTAETATIDGVVPPEKIPQELLYFNTGELRLVVPRGAMQGYSWYAAPAPADEAAFIAYARGVLDTAYPAGAGNDEYMRAGFSTRVYKTDDYSRVMNLALELVAVFLYAFAALLMLIGFTNVISTLSANVLLRAREFAVLQSIGMTPRGLTRMLALESVLCSAKALAWGLPLGVGVTLLINWPIRQMYPIPYQFPAAAVVLCAGAVFAVTWCVTRAAARKLQKQNIIETLRTEAGR